MQDEVAKHTKKIYKTMTNSHQSFWEKLKEVAIEIFIIVFAVTLSISLHNWSDNRHEQREVREFLTGLKDDLSKDIQLMQANRSTFVEIDSNFNMLSALNVNKGIDTTSSETLSHLFDFEERVTHPSIGRYEGFKSAGKIGTIEKDSLKQLILVYYEQTMKGVQDDETFANQLQTKMLDLMVDRDDNNSGLRGLAKSFKMRASLEIINLNLRGCINAYTAAIQEAKVIITQIDRIYGASKSE